MAVTRAQALEAFGDYQGAMVQGDAYVHHSVIPPNLNIGLLDPVDTCRHVVEEWQAERAPGRARSTCHTGISARHRDRLVSNPRMGPVCRTWERMPGGDAILGRLSAGEVV
ncbi:hypothetical protein [Sediminimonas sp.]|uniref:hypothetical protein n=1 Tax=Sediminimonas sp. TaxID=2823379 RepID=UPI0025D20A0A|nr:hypothetical protein [Sediminimonas sp.]